MIKLKKKFVLLICLSLGFSLVYLLFFNGTNIDISLRFWNAANKEELDTDEVEFSGILLLESANESINNTESSERSADSLNIPPVEPNHESANNSESSERHVDSFNIPPVEPNHHSNHEETRPIKGREEKLGNSPSVAARGPGDTNFPFEEEFAAQLSKFPVDLFKEKAKGIDPPDSYNPPLKKILFWNDGYGDKHFGMGFGREPFIRAGCRVNTCMTTGDRKRFPPQEIDAVIWHFRARDLSLPEKRSQHTRYVFWVMESATHLYGNIRKFNHIFNWTFTYRLDSDIPNPYNIVYRRRNPLPVQDVTNITSRKTRFAAWFVSNCNTAGGRKTLVKTLQKWIKVDIYGVCGPLKCDRKHQWDTCYKMLESDYKFYFSFENSLCKDYATEKFFNILKLNVVPVVYGMGNYSLLAPPHSFINALEFPTAKALAEYLLYLSKNDTAYNEYFMWKRFHRVAENWERVSRPWCELCERLHVDQKQKIYNLHDWFVKKSHCKTRYSSDISNFVNG